MNLTRTSSLALTILVLISCGDSQLSQSRREPFFVLQPAWQTIYAPGLTVITPFPGLDDPDAPPWVSKDPRVAQVSVVSEGFQSDASSIFPPGPVIRLATGALGRASIGHRLAPNSFSGHYSVEVVKPTRWLFDFTVQNQVAPREAALFPEETVQVLAFTHAFATVRVFARVGPELGEVLNPGPGVTGLRDVELVASGLVETTDGLLLEVLRGETIPFPIPTGEFPSNQLTSGELVSVSPTSAVSRASLELPNGQTIESSPIESVDSVQALQLVVGAERGVEGRADVAVFGLSDSARVIGLSPVVTLDGEPLPAFSGQARVGEVFTRREWPWLFSLPEGATGTLEARWKQLSASIDL